jgi:hypothetical protein
MRHFHHCRPDRNATESIFLLCFCAIMFGCAETGSVENRDFAIDTCFPTQNEIQLAQGRAKSYWAKHASSFGPESRFLAVEASRPFPDEIQDLYPKLINSQTTASFFGQGGDYSELDLHGIMIYDTKSAQFVSNQGYVCVDTPARGSVARFGPYTARYIGWG